MARATLVALATVLTVADLGRRLIVTALTGGPTMVDNRPDTRRSMRTPLARVKGLGAAGHGVDHWWIHRVTAVSNIPLIIAFVIDRGDARRPLLRARRCGIVSHPLVAILLILAVISVTNHMRLGMQLPIEDYVHQKGLKLAALIANNFFAVLIAVICLYAILKISFGRV